MAKEEKEVEADGADYIHIDVMDGHFVPNITIGPLMRLDGLNDIEMFCFVKNSVAMGNAYH